MQYRFRYRFTISGKCTRVVYMVETFESLLRSLSPSFLRSFRLQWKRSALDSKSLNTFCFLITNLDRHLCAIMFLSNNVSFQRNFDYLCRESKIMGFFIQWAFFYVINSFRYFLMFFDNDLRKSTHDFGNGEGEWNAKFWKERF